MNYLKIILLAVSVSILSGCGSSENNSEESLLSSDKMADVLDAKKLPKPVDLNLVDVKNIETVSLELLEQKLFLWSSEAKPPKKDEFETTPDYEKKVQGFIPYTSLFGSTPYNQYYLAYLPTKYGYKITYDADKQALDTKINYIVFQPTEEIETNKQKTTARNRLGEEIDIIARDKTIYKLDAPDIDFMETLAPLPMLPEQARKIKDNLEIMLIFSLRPHWIQSRNQEENTTVENPVSGQTKFHSLVARVDQLWLFDNSTKKVVHKWVNESPERDPGIDYSNVETILEGINAENAKLSHGYNDESVK